MRLSMLKSSLSSSFMRASCSCDSVRLSMPSIMDESLSSKRSRSIRSISKSLSPSRPGIADKGPSSSRNSSLRTPRFASNSARFSSRFGSRPLMLSAEKSKSSPPSCSSDGKPNAPAELFSFSGLLPTDPILSIARERSSAVVGDTSFLLFLVPLFFTPSDLDVFPLGPKAIAATLLTSTIPTGSAIVLSILSGTAMLAMPRSLIVSSEDTASSSAVGCSEALAGGLLMDALLLSSSAFFLRPPVPFFFGFGGRAPEESPDFPSSSLPVGAGSSTATLRARSASIRVPKAICRFGRMQLYYIHKR